jgi:hypothetical protein
MISQSKPMSSIVPTGGWHTARSAQVKISAPLVKPRAVVTEVPDLLDMMQSQGEFDVPKIVSQRLPIKIPARKYSKADRRNRIVDDENFTDEICEDLFDDGVSSIDTLKNHTSSPKMNLQSPKERRFESTKLKKSLPAIQNSRSSSYDSAGIGTNHHANGGEDGIEDDFETHGVRGAYYSNNEPVCTMPYASLVTQMMQKF